MQVGVAPATQQVVTGSALEGVEAGVAVQDVVVAEGGQNVPAVAAEHPVGAVAARQQVVLQGADDLGVDANHQIGRTRRQEGVEMARLQGGRQDRKSTRLNSSH